ncbi:MAG: hypothetical protein J6K46_03540 [Sutterella sp.]|nr:hypothetical protein [Sutterella sp.]
MSNTVNTSGTAALSEVLAQIDLGPTDSIQFAFAKLQLAQAQICKNSASEYMKQIEEIQKEQSEVADMISRARQLQNEAKTGDKCTTMPDDMVKFFEDRGLSYDTKGNDNKHDSDQWTYNIESLTNYQESISNKTQTLMVYLQDFISQYNSYLQGANSAISNASQVLTAVATGR